MVMTYHVAVRKSTSSRTIKFDCASKSEAYGLAKKKRLTLESTGFVQVFKGPRGAWPVGKMVAFLTTESALFDIVSGRAARMEK